LIHNRPPPFRLNLGSKSLDCNFGRTSFNLGSFSARAELRFGKFGSLFSVGLLSYCYELFMTLHIMNCRFWWYSCLDPSYHFKVLYAVCPQNMLSVCLEIQSLRLVRLISLSNLYKLWNGKTDNCFLWELEVKLRKGWRLQSILRQAVSLSLNSGRKYSALFVESWENLHFHWQLKNICWLGICGLGFADLKLRFFLNLFFLGSFSDVDLDFLEAVMIWKSEPRCLAESLSSDDLKILTFLRQWCLAESHLFFGVVCVAFRRWRCDWQILRQWWFEIWAPSFVILLCLSCSNLRLVF
jgi:hypothetical protein